MNGHRETEKKLKTLVRVWFLLFKRFKAKGTETETGDEGRFEKAHTLERTHAHARTLKRTHTTHTHQRLHSDQDDNRRNRTE